MNTTATHDHSDHLLLHDATFLLSRKGFNTNFILPSPYCKWKIRIENLDHTKNNPNRTISQIKLSLVARGSKMKNVTEILEELGFHYKVGVWNEQETTEKNGKCQILTTNRSNFCVLISLTLLWFSPQHKKIYTRLVVCKNKRKKTVSDDFCWGLVKPKTRKEEDILTEKEKEIEALVCLCWSIFQ